MSRTRKQMFGELAAFTAVAEEGNFARAAARLGLSAAALTRTIQGLEARLGVPLLNRTTRSVSLTHAGQRLRALGPAIDALEHDLSSLAELGGDPSGKVCIHAPREAASALWEALAPVMLRHSVIELDLVCDDQPPSPGAARPDARVIVGEQVERDAATIRIGPDRRMALVASPAYLAAHSFPKTPRDLSAHECVVAPSRDAIWAFERIGVRVDLRPAGRFAFADNALALRAALDGFGIAYLFEEDVARHLATGRLVRLLADWSATAPGYFLQYADNRPLSPAFEAIVEGLRHQSGATTAEPAARRLRLVE